MGAFYRGVFGGDRPSSYMKFGIRVALTSLAASLSILVSCDQYSLAETLGEGALDNVVPLSIHPRSVSTAPGGSYQFTASGGVPPYRFAVVEGDGSIDRDDGLYRSTGTIGDVLVAVTDDFGNTSSAEVEVTGEPVPLTVSPQSISIGVGDTVELTVAGGVPQYTYSLAGTGDGTLMPAGNNRARYTASTPGSRVIRVYDLDIDSDPVEALVEVTAAPLSVEPMSLAVLVNDVIQFTVGGGVPPYTFDVTPGAASGISPEGQFQAGAAEEAVQVIVTDSTSSVATADVDVIAPTGGLIVMPQTLTLPALGSHTFVAAGGTEPYSFALAGSGSIDAAGLYIAGPTGDTVTITVTDATLTETSATVTIDPPKALTIKPSSATIVSGDAIGFTAAGGTGGYVFSLFSGDGTVGAGTGVYDSAAPGVAVVRTTDSANVSTDATVTVVSSGPLAIVPGNITVEQGGSVLFIPSGGLPPYSFALASGVGTVDSTSGVFGAVSAVGAAVVRLTDADDDIVEANVMVIPRAPSNLSADGAFPGPQTILITWQDNTGSEDSFVLERMEDGTGTWEQIAVLAADTIDYVDNGLSPQDVQHYRVRAVENGVPSAWSNTDSAAGND